MSGCWGLLQLDGYQFVTDPEQADFVVVNTCGFIADAREESFAAIDDMLELKRQRPYPRRHRHRVSRRAAAEVAAGRTA